MGRLTIGTSKEVTHFFGPFVKLSLALFILVAFQSCSSPSNNPVAQTPVKGADAKPKKGVTGTLVDQKRKPVAHSMVEALLGGSDVDPSQSTASARVVDSVMTDDQGRYSFDTLPAGSYTLNGNFQNGSLVVLIRNVKYAGGDSLLEVPTDTLRAPGKISGRVALLDQDHGGIICYVPGTSFIALTDDSGAFVLSNIPQGRYTLAYRKDGLKTAKDTSVEVTAGQTTTLQPIKMEADPAYPPPAPSNLTALYDSLTGVVTLRWRSVFVSDLTGYNIYEGDPLLAPPARLNSGLIKDTSYRDTRFPPMVLLPEHSRDFYKLWKGPPTHFDSIGDFTYKLFSYRVKSQDSAGNMSTSFSNAVQVKISESLYIRTYMRYNDGVDNDFDSQDPTKTSPMIWHDYDKDGGIRWDYDDSARFIGYGGYPQTPQNAQAHNIGHPLHRYLHPELYLKFTDSVWTQRTMIGGVFNPLRQSVMIKYCMDISLGLAEIGKVDAALKKNLISAICSTYTSILKPNVRPPVHSDWIGGTFGIDEEMVDDMDNDFDGLVDEDVRNGKGMDDDGDALLDVSMVGTVPPPMVWEDVAGHGNACPDIDTTQAMLPPPLQREFCLGALEHRIYLAQHGGKDTLKTYYAPYLGEGPSRFCLDQFDMLSPAYKSMVGITSSADPAVRLACQFKHIWIHGRPLNSEWTSGVLGIDEEILDGIDNDGDGLIDEDVR